MPRADLLLLTTDDLAELTNLGTVKRAQKELESGEPTCQIVDDERGGVTVSWSDGSLCRFLAGKTIHDAVCSSGVTGISRHIVRSVLAYQRANTGTTDPSAGAESTEPDGNDRVSTNDAARGTTAASLRVGEVWDPGQFSDEELVTCFRKPAFAKARKRFEQGVLAELLRGAKPVARFLDEACTVRFLVPRDLRYATADCAEALWSTWVPVAVWAFRELPASQMAGLVCSRTPAPAPPLDVLKDVRVVLDELCRDGLSGVSSSWLQRLLRIELALRNAGLVWPAELLLEISHQHEMYQNHDARFDPGQLVHLVGELTARTRAIAHETSSVPQPLIRGTKSDRATDIAGGRFIGVGLGVYTGRRHATLSAYLQEANSGTVVAVERSFADPDPESGHSPRSFTELAETTLVRGASIGDLASSQLLLETGKRTPNGQLILPRRASSLTINPQSFQWERFKPPFAAESFAQLLARLRMLPPSYLRPRRRTENLHGVAVAGVEQVHFDVARQQLNATLRDARGDSALLIHPFHERAAAGFNSLMESLEKRGAQIRFVSGRVQLAGSALVVHPVLLIAEDGERRLGINPWITDSVATSTLDGAATQRAALTRSDSAPERFLSQLHESLADLLLTGVRTSQAARRWSDEVDRCHRLGFVRIAGVIAQLSNSLAERANALDWNPESSVRQCRQLCLISRVAEG